MFLKGRCVMSFEELTKEKGCHISFESILEPRIDGIKLRIIVNKSDNPTDLLIYPHPDSNVTRLQIDFKNYITYYVIYDDYTKWNDEEEYEGESFGIYKKSNFFRFLQEDTSLGSYFPNGTITHYSLSCIEHRIDIISKYEPVITEIH